MTLQCPSTQSSPNKGSNCGIQLRYQRRWIRSNSRQREHHQRLPLWTTTCPHQSHPRSQEAKCLKMEDFRMLGFVDKSKVPRHALMGDVEIVVPSKDNPLGLKLFTAFIYSMISLNKYGLARYVPETPKTVLTLNWSSSSLTARKEGKCFTLLNCPQSKTSDSIPSIPSSNPMTNKNN